MNIIIIIIISFHIFSPEIHQKYTIDIIICTIDIIIYTYIYIYHTISSGGHIHNYQPNEKNPGDLVNVQADLAGHAAYQMELGYPHSNSDKNG